MIVALVTTRRNKLTDVTIEMRKTCNMQEGDPITVIRQDNKPSGTSYPTRLHTLAGAGQEYLQSSQCSPCRWDPTWIQASDASTDRTKIRSWSPRGSYLPPLPLRCRNHLPSSSWQTAWEDRRTGKKRVGSLCSPWPNMCLAPSARSR
jgi:hypothetical protein